MPTHSVFPLMLVRTAGLPFGSLEALAASWQTAEEEVAVGSRQYLETAANLQVVLDRALDALGESPFRTRVYNLRKRFFQTKKLPAEPALSAWAGKEQERWAAEIRKSVAALQDAERALVQAKKRFLEHYETALCQSWEALQALAQSEAFQRGMLFASHALLEQLPQFYRKPADQFGKKQRQTALSVLQFVARMAAKTSPLSRFTTVSMAKTTPNELADVAEEIALTKSLLQPNVALLEAIYSSLLRNPAFYRTLSIALNPCIVSPGQDRYEWLYFNGREEGFQMAEASPLLDFIVALFLEHRRRLPFNILLRELANAIDAPESDLEVHILEWVDLGLLEWQLPEYGLDPAWPGNLYRYLGFLSTDGRIVQTAAFLQWMQTAARTLPFQPVAAARAIQGEARDLAGQYFSSQGTGSPPLPVEQLFYEDVAEPVALHVPPANLKMLIDQLAACWTNRPERPLPAHRSAVKTFWEKHYSNGEPVGFLTFCRRFLAEKSIEDAVECPTPGRFPEARRIGALLQVYREEGDYFAVVNSLFPGGGKLFARWLPLFPAENTGLLRKWLHEQLPDSTVAFPWQGWYNANMQPPLTMDALAVPGGRTVALPGGTACLLGNLDVVAGYGGPGLRDRVSGRRLILNDLGLEANETRPPVMQLLWQLGTPYVSIEALIPVGLWQTMPGAAVRRRTRCVEGNLVLARAAWALEETAWRTWLEGNANEAEFFFRVRTVFSGLGIPRYFFARLPGEKPQYFDLDSPALIGLLRRILRKGAGLLTITEMLPLPHQLVVERHGPCVSEFAVEFAL